MRVLSLLPPGVRCVGCDWCERCAGDGETPRPVAVPVGEVGSVGVRARRAGDGSVRGLGSTVASPGGTGYECPGRRGYFSGSDQVHAGEVGAVAGSIAGKQAVAGRFGVRPDVEVGQRGRFVAAAAPVGKERLAGAEGGLPG